MIMAARILSFMALLGFAAAECPNACSGHGTCSLHDQCTCCRNWQGNDCSQRTCPFGYAHVDSPKGDLDGSTGTLSGPNYPLIVGSTVYPFGTTEQYPDASSNEGHFYMECSNKGMCNRDEGTCECFPGYEGSACQRTSCPNDCSGHGTCETIKELAEDREDGDLSKGYYAMNGFSSDHAGIGDLSAIGDITYELWDKTLTQGCKCDPGFMGPDCSMKICRYGVDPLFIPSNYLYSADGVIEYDFDAPHFEKAFVEIIGGQGMKGQFDLTIYDVYGEKYVLDALNYAAFETGNYTSCADIMAHFPNDKIKDTVTGTFHHQMAHKGGLVSSAYVGGATKPFCMAMMVNQTNQDADGNYRKQEIKDLFQADQTGIRYEFDYNRGNPGYIKDLYIDNLTPEPTYAEDTTDSVVYGYYGIIKQGEVAEYSDINKNFNPTTNRFMYSDDNLFQSGKHDVKGSRSALDYGVTLPGYIIEAHNSSHQVLLSRDVHFYIEPTSCLAEYPEGSSCKQYKTSKVMIFGKEYHVNKTAEEWLEVEAPHTSDYIVGPEQEDYKVRSHVFRPVTNLTLTEPVIFPDEGPFAVDYKNITYKWSGGPGRSSTSKSLLLAVPEKVTVKAKLTQVYQYVSECSGRGTCDRETGLCSCFSGYSNDNCDTQTPVC
jgi:hypothetical protein